MVSARDYSTYRCLECRVPGCLRCNKLTHMAVIECVPNVSEGRRPDVIERHGRRAARRCPACACSTSSPTRRTTARCSRSPATPPRWPPASRCCSSARVAAIDLRTHKGEHPRLGAVDVVPFIPIEGVTMAECVDAGEGGRRGRGGALRAAGLSLRRRVGESGAEEPRRHPPRRVRGAGREDGASRNGRPTSVPPRRIRPPARR